MDINSERSFAGQAVSAYRQTSTRPIGDAPETPSQIRDAIGLNEQTLSELHAVISHIESRLDTILTPNAPNVVSNAKDGTMPPARSHLLERAFTRRIAESQMRANGSAGLLQRVEL